MAAPKDISLLAAYAMMPYEWPVQIRQQKLQRNQIADSIKWWEDFTPITTQIAKEMANNSERTI